MMRLVLTSHLHIAGNRASGQGIIKHTLDDQSYGSDRIRSFPVLFFRY